MKSQLETNREKLIVKVKLLSTEVHEFEVEKSMNVIDFKNFIKQKVSISPERMRIVFSGKQLLNDKKLSQYISQSGTTVYLIAKSVEPSSQQPTSPQSTSLSSQENPNPTDFMNFLNQLHGGQGQGARGISSTSIIISSSSNGLLNNLPDPYINPQLQRPQQYPHFRQERNDNIRARIDNSRIQQLNDNINRLNLPQQNFSLYGQITKQGLVHYLRRLQNQTVRTLGKLNDAVFLFEQGNPNVLRNFVPIFQSLNESNTEAINFIQDITRNQSSYQDSICNDGSIRTSIMISQNRNGKVETQTIVRNNYEQEGDIMIQNTEEDPHYFEEISVEGSNLTMNMTIREISQFDHSRGVLSQVFSQITVKDIFITCVQKKFDYLDKKFVLIKQNLEKIIQKNGKQNFVKKATQQLSILLIPQLPDKILNLQKCLTQGKQHIQKYVVAFMNLTLSDKMQNYAQKIKKLMKKGFESVLESNVKNIQSNNQDYAFTILKRQILLLVNKYFSGIGEMFYMIAEKQLKKIYEFYKSEKQKFLMKKVEQSENQNEEFESNKNQTQDDQGVRKQKNEKEDH